MSGNLKLFNRPVFWTEHLGAKLLPGHPNDSLPAPGVFWRDATLPDLDQGYKVPGNTEANSQFALRYLVVFAELDDRVVAHSATQGNTKKQELQAVSRQFWRYIK